MLENKVHYRFVDLFKAIAVLLVLNSHFDRLYPISALGTGGSLGNGLFFAVSGFCLWPVKGTFKNWIGKKAVRLYLPALLMTAVLIFAHGKKLLVPANILPIFVWPTMYWFVGAIFLFYVIYFLLRNITEKKQFLMLFIVLTGMYIPCYLTLDTTKWIVDSGWSIENGLHNTFTASCKLICFFGLMMAGKYLRVNLEKIHSRPRLYLLNAAGGGISLYAVKFLMARYPVFFCIQFLNHLSVIWFVVSMMLWGISMEKKLVLNGLAGNAVKKISELSLEFYVVQGSLIEIAERWSFPVNILLAVCLTFVCAIILHRVVLAMERPLKKRG